MSENKTDALQKPGTFTAISFVCREFLIILILLLFINELFLTMFICTCVKESPVLFRKCKFGLGLSNEPLKKFLQLDKTMKQSKHLNGIAKHF